MASPARILRVLLLPVAAVLLSCGDDGGGRADAGTADGGTEGGTDAAADGGMLVLPEVALPEMGECAGGWRRVTDGDAAYCDPWPEAGVADCTAPDETHFPGDPGCTRLGSACPDAGDWAADLPGDATIVYVREGATAGGDGTMAQPFATLADGIAAASDGDVVALAAGTYDGPVTVPAGVTLWGACTAETVIETDVASADLEGVVTAGGPGAALRNLRIEGARPGIDVPEDTSLDVIDVVVSNARSLGVRVEGGLTAHGLVVREIGDETGAAERGLGIIVYRIGSARVERAVVERVARGIWVHGMAELSDLAVRDTGFYGIAASLRGSATITRLAADRNVDAAVAAWDFGTEATVRDSVLRDTRASPGEGLRLGPALFALDGGSIVAERVTMLGNTTTDVIARVRTSTVELTDAVMLDTRPGPDGLAGSGLMAEDYGEVRATRALLQRNHHVAVQVRFNGTATLTDLTIAETRSIPSLLTDGRAVQLHDDAEVSIERAVIRRSREVAIGVESSTLEMSGVRIADTLPEEGTDRGGYGLQASGAATVTITASAIERSRGVGLAAFDPATSVTATGLRIEDTDELACAADDCGSMPLGYGVVTAAGAAVEITDFEIASSAQVAVQLEGGGTADLHDGLVVDAPVGFNIQTSGFDEARLRDGVSLSGVALEVDLSTLPLPSQVPPIGI